MNIDWKTVKEYEDITYKKSGGVARIAFNRPNVRNAFRPKTTSELYDAFYHAYEDASTGVILLSAEGPSTKDGVYAFCSGGDQKVRGEKGYVGEDGRHRLNILEVQRLIR
ncbi:MAG TPA: enoyl-CoA hydratase-related protein, partial [Cytophagales bacterium]|nr:enoyl-CoA hydratase-related protein [Cytophagales bacterium]